jgi:outer membrane murein-binding lipoprotein Lpp
MTSLDDHCSKQYDKILDYAIMNRLMLGGSGDHSAADRVLAQVTALAARVAELTSLLKAAADEDSDCYMMGTGWHGKVRNAIAGVEKS